MIRRVTGNRQVSRLASPRQPIHCPLTWLIRLYECLSSVLTIAAITFIARLSRSARAVLPFARHGMLPFADAGGACYAVARGQQAVAVAVRDP